MIKYTEYLETTHITVESEDFSELLAQLKKEKYVINQVAQIRLGDVEDARQFKEKYPSVYIFEKNGSYYFKNIICAREIESISQLKEIKTIGVSNTTAKGVFTKDMFTKNTNAEKTNRHKLVLFSENIKHEQVQSYLQRTNPSYKTLPVVTKVDLAEYIEFISLYLYREFKAHNLVYDVTEMEGSGLVQVNVDLTNHANLEKLGRFITELLTSPKANLQNAFKSGMKQIEIREVVFAYSNYHQTAKSEKYYIQEIEHIVSKNPLDIPQIVDGLGIEFTAMAKHATENSLLQTIEPKRHTIRIRFLHPHTQITETYILPLVKSALSAKVYHKRSNSFQSELIPLNEFIEFSAKTSPIMRDFATRYIRMVQTLDTFANMENVKRLTTSDVERNNRFVQLMKDDVEMVCTSHGRYVIVSFKKDMRVSMVLTPNDVIVMTPPIAPNQYVTSIHVAANNRDDMSKALHLIVKVNRELLPNTKKIYSALQHARDLRRNV